MDLKELQGFHQLPGRSSSRVRAGSGRHLRSVPLHDRGGPYTIDLPATFKSAVLRSASEPSLPQPLRCDLRCKIYQQRQKRLILFVVDASESMGEGTVERMKAAKGAILGLLTTAYQNRDLVALVAFRGQQAEILLQPTSSVLLARQGLRQLPIGGATPFADGLWQSRQLIRSARRKHPQMQPLLVIVSDGEANVPLVTGAEVFPELFELGRTLRKERLKTVVVDSSSTASGNKNLRHLASEMAGDYRQIRDLHAGRLYAIVNASGQEQAG